MGNESDAFGYWDDLGYYHLEGFEIAIKTVVGSIRIVPRVLTFAGVPPHRNNILSAAHIECHQWKVSSEAVFGLAGFESFRENLAKVYSYEAKTARLDVCERLPSFRLDIRESRECPGHALICDCIVAVPDLAWETRPEGQRWDGSRQDELLPYFATAKVVMAIEYERLMHTCDQISALCRHLRNA